MLTPNIELKLRRPPFWSAATVFVPLVYSIYAVSAVYRAVEGGESTDWSFRLLVLLAIAAATIVVRAATRPESVPSIRAYSDHLKLPVRAGSMRTRIVPYEEILSFNVVGMGRRAKLLIGTQKKLIWYPIRALVDSDAVDQLRVQVREWIGGRDNGHRLVEEFEQREALGRVAWKKKPVITGLLLGLIAAVFGFEWTSGVLDELFGLVRYGANVPELVADGQLFRLASANFLHANLVHVYSNGFALYWLGRLLEGLVGPWRFTTIYLLGAFGGSLASTLFSPGAYSVGASTAIFGVLGSLAVVNWRFRGQLPGGFHQTRSWWFLILGLNTLLPVVAPQIDVAAHLGGFLVGASATALLCRSTESIDRTHGDAGGVKVAALTFAALFSVGLAQAAHYARSPQPADELRVARAYVMSDHVDAEAMNDLAWIYAADPAATRDQLDVARLAAERAVDQRPNDWRVLDTLATTYHRLGLHDEAIASERRAVRVKMEPFAISQLARFLASRNHAMGPSQIGPGAESSAIRLEVEPRNQSIKSRRTVLFHTSSAYEKGAEIYALVMRQEQLQGVVRVELGPNLEPQQHRFLSTGSASADNWPDDIDFDIVLVDTTSCNGCKRRTWKWKYWPIDPAVHELP